MFRKMMSAMKRFEDYMNDTLNLAYKANPGMMYIAGTVIM